MTIDTTSTGMPPIASHDTLDTPPFTTASKSPAAVQSLLGEGKAQIGSTLTGLADAVREIAHKLEGSGATPIARYVHDAADSVSDWSRAVEAKSVDDLVGDAKSLVRTSPTLAVGIALAAGFAVSRVFRSAR